MSILQKLRFLKTYENVTIHNNQTIRANRYRNLPVVLIYRGLYQNLTNLRMKMNSRVSANSNTLDRVLSWLVHH